MQSGKPLPEDQTALFFTAKGNEQVRKTIHGGEDRLEIGPLAG
jgi:hypothetical protein